MLFASDKQGTHPHPQSLLNGFRLAIEDCGLSELSLNGGAFTWEKSKGSFNWVREKLDRAFANAQWWRKFPLCNLSVTHTIYSDHDRIILEPLAVTWSRKQFRFKFENTWLNEPSFKNEVATYWKSIPPMQMLLKLLSVSSFMAKWGRNFFHKFRDKVKLLKENIALLVNRTDDIGIKQYFEEKNKLDELLYHEELYWKQRAKSFWLTEGDTNSKYFHAAATKRKKINHISQLLNVEGVMVSTHDAMCDLAVDYYRNIFKDDTATDGVNMNGARRVITAEQNDQLTSVFNFDEFTTAVAQMHPDKSAGPDGFSPAFF